MTKKYTLTVSSVAKKKLDSIYDYLVMEYSTDQADKFIVDFYHIVNLVLKYPKMFKASSKSKLIRIGWAHKHVSFFYRIKANAIHIITIKDNRSKPNPIDR